MTCKYFALKNGCCGFVRFAWIVWAFCVSYRLLTNRRVKMFEALLLLVKSIQTEVNKQLKNVKQLYLLSISSWIHQKYTLSIFLEDFNIYEISSYVFARYHKWLLSFTTYRDTKWNWSLKIHCDLNTLFSESRGVGCRIVLPWHKFWYLFSLRQVGVFYDMNFIVTWLRCELYFTTLQKRSLTNLVALHYHKWHSLSV